MSLASTALLATLTAAVVVGLTARTVAAAHQELWQARRREVRHRAWVAERSRFVATRTSLAAAARGTADAVELGTAAAQAGHRTVASIPFAVLGAIPATRGSSRRIRVLHDEISDGVYAAVAEISQGLSSLAGTLLTGERVRPPDAGESAPPGPATPPAGRPG